MSNFFKKLTDDIGKGKSFLLVLIIAIFAFLDPLNKLIKTFKELPPIISVAGVYAVFLTILLYVRSSKKEATAGAAAENRYTNNERKWAGIVLLFFTACFAAFVVFWAVDYLNDRKEAKEKGKMTKEEEEKRRKQLEERNKLVNVYTA